MDFTVECTPDAVGNLSSETFSGTTYYTRAQSLADMALLYNVAGDLSDKHGEVRELALLSASFLWDQEFDSEDDAVKYLSTR